MIKWKLQNIIQKKNLNISSEFFWSQQSYTLQEILQKFKLPCLVLCTSPCPLQWNTFHFDLRQPLLVHSTKRVKKAIARCLRRNTNGQLEGLGTCVVIPEDYNGWFTLVADGNEIKPFTSIKEVSESNIQEFVVAKDTAAKLQNQKARKISSGEVLRKTSSDSGVKDSRNYLHCKDDKDEEMLISYFQKGKFYQVSDDPNCKNCVVLMSNIMKSTLKCPIYLRHVVGEIPMLTSAYSSLLQVVSIFEEETALASTLDKQTMMPLELQTASAVKFNISLNESRLRHFNSYCEALKFCEEDGEDYMTGMKVAFQLSPELLRESDTSLASSGTLMAGNSVSSLTEADVLLDEESFYSDSDFGEEDAQSEFTFKWTPATKKADGATVNMQDKNGSKEHIGPKVFNSCINSAKSSTESVIWNETPDFV